MTVLPVSPLHIYLFMLLLIRASKLISCRSLRTNPCMKSREQQDTERKCFDRMLTKSEFDQIHRQNVFMPLWQIIYQDIRNDISAGTLLPGDKISEIKIANTLGISRSPVKKALDMLIDEGSLKKDGKKGPRVADLSIKDYISLFEARKMLEGTAACLAAKELLPESFNHLEHCLLLLKKAAEKNNIEEYRKYDRAFHHAIVLATSNKYLIHMYDCICQDLSRYQFALTRKTELEKTDENYLAGEYRKHLRIFNSIKNGMALEARDAVETDLMTMYKTICQL